MAEVKEKRYPFPEDVKKKEKMEKKANEGVYTADKKTPAPSPPDMGSVKTMAKGGLVTSRGQGKVMRTKKTRIC
jgi:hypothetical protein